MYKSSVPRKVFVICNGVILTVFTLICLLPFLNLLAVSLSSSEAATSGEVAFWPVNFTTQAYEFLLKKQEFFVAFGYSVLRVVLGTSISVMVVMLAAYAISRERNPIKGRRVYIVLFIITMFFNGGLVPTYIVIVNLHLYNTIWALVLPTAANAWNMVLFINFFRQVPKDLEEYAELEGAGHISKLFQIILPISLPALATVVLFTAVMQWNAWFDGYIYMRAEKFPLQTYIYDIVQQIQTLSNNPNLSQEERLALANLPGKTLRSAQIFVAMLPIMLVYPFAQKFFIKGLVMGAVKE